jgi:hypothetical protein
MLLGALALNPGPAQAAESTTTSVAPLDTSPPAVESFSPAQGTQDVPVVEIITVTFSEPLADSVYEGLVALETAGEAVPARISLDGESTVRLYPDFWLDKGTETR